MVKLHDAGNSTTQIGRTGEASVWCIEHGFDLDWKQMKTLLDGADLFVTVDTFFCHFAAYHNRSGVVIYSQSDPKIFGYEHNTNLFKPQYFRTQQYQLWSMTPYIAEAFPTVDEVFKAIINHGKK